MTPSQTVGPFFHFITRADLSCVTRPGAEGDCIRLRVRLLDGDGTAVTDGLIEIWQADTSGFGRLATDGDGFCVFETIYPGRVPDGGGAMQAPHLNVSVFARGLLERLCTRIYFEGDEALGEDPVLAVVPEDRRHTLIARRDAGEWNFTIRLQGDEETVFFDI